MKYSVLLLAVLALVVVSDAQVLFQHNKLPCKWNVDISVKSLLKRYKLKLNVYDQYLRYLTENYNDVVVSDAIFRPDADFTYKYEYSNTSIVYISKFSYDGSSCRHCDSPNLCGNPITAEAWKENMLKSSGIAIHFTDYLEVIPVSFTLDDLFHAYNFTNSVDNVKYDDETCKLYFNNYTLSTEGRDNKDIFSMYVDKNNRIVAIVTDNDRPGVRTEYKFKYSLEVEPKDFMYKEKYIWNCTRPEVMKEPTKFLNSKCSSASVAQVALLALLASLLCALLF